jgi:hypothetical protein
MTEKKTAPAKKRSKKIVIPVPELERIIRSGGIDGLLTREDLPPTIMYWVQKYSKKLGKAWQDYMKEREDALKLCAERDEDGKVVYTDDKQQAFKIPKDRLDEAEKLVEEIRSQDIELEMNRMDKTLMQLCEELEGKEIKMNGLQLGCLEFLYSE